MDGTVSRWTKRRRIKAKVEEQLQALEACENVQTLGNSYRPFASVCDTADGIVFGNLNEELDCQVEGGEESDSEDRPQILDFEERESDAEERSQISDSEQGI